MELIDIIILLPILWGAYNGFQRGIVVELISIVAFIVGILLAFKFLHEIMEFLSPYLTGAIAQKVLPYVGFLSIFIPFIFLINRLGYYLRKSIKFTFVGRLDSILGSFVGAFTWAFGLSICFWLMSSIGIKFSEKSLSKTIIYPYIKPIAPSIISKTVDDWIPALKKTQKRFNS